jgi:hypothetical protein
MKAKSKIAKVNIRDELTMLNLLIDPVKLKKIKFGTKFI